jgi:hypothetical protein
MSQLKPVVKTVHMCVSIEGAIRNKAYKAFTQYNGRNAKLVEKMLRYELAMGRRVLPVGDCDNFDYQEGCKGHFSTTQTGE